MQKHFHRSRILGSAVLAGLLSAGAVQAESDKDGMNHEKEKMTHENKDRGQTTAITGAAVQARDTDEAREAIEQVQGAAEVLGKMKQDPGTEALLERAQGLFILPQYGRGAAVVGARGGEGVLVIRNEDDWAGPAFYDYGGLSVGAQAGGKGGSIVMILMTEEAVEGFKGDTDFSVTADAGLTIAEYSEQAQASLPNNDVVVWSDTEGLFAGAAIGMTGIRRDADDNRAYYDKAASVDQIFMGSVTNPHSQELHEELPSQVAAR